MSTRFIAASEVDSAPLEDGGVVLLHPTNGKFTMLNRSSGVLWNALALPRTEDELAAALCDSFPDLSRAEALEDARDAVEQMTALELLSTLDDSGAR